MITSGGSGAVVAGGSVASGGDAVPAADRGARIHGGRSALAGEKVSHEYDTFSVQGFRAGLVPDPAPPVLLAALRPGMLRLAGREADGAIGGHGR